MIGKFAGQFSGYGQQDSQEFISYLIDGLQEDLNLVKKSKHLNLMIKFAQINKPVYRVKEITLKEFNHISET